MLIFFLFLFNYSGNASKCTARDYCFQPQPVCVSDACPSPPPTCYHATKDSAQFLPTAVS